MRTTHPRIARKAAAALALMFTLLTAAGLPLPSSAADDQTFSQQELDQMMAPVALYPDSLLSQILMASTYPDQVAEAAKWSKDNPEQKGDDAVKAVQDKPWDPSVSSLVAFPQALSMMGAKPDWVEQMGDAFLAEPDKVMDTVQSLRKKAKEAGNLESSEQQKVTVEEQSSQTVIKIESANPQVVYVPTYNPTVIYGTWWWPAYPPFYYPPPPGYGFGAGLAAGIGFGIGIAITDSIWGSFDWYRHDVNINVNRYNNINVNKRIDIDKNNVSWKHDAINRKGRPYADKASQKKYGQKLDGADQRKDFRGRDAERDKARAALQKKGLDPAAERRQLQGSGGERVRQEVSQVDRSRANDLAGKARNQASAGQAGGLKGVAGSERKAGAGARTAQAGGSGHAFQGINDQHGGRLGADRGARSTRSLAGGGGRLGGGGGGRLGGRR